MTTSMTNPPTAPTAVLGVNASVNPEAHAPGRATGATPVGRRWSAWPLAAAAATVGLTACFGGGGDSPVASAPAPAADTLPPDPLAGIPASATATVSGVLTYQFVVLQVGSDKTDKAEPIDLTNVTLPSSDTTEPADV